MKTLKWINTAAFAALIVVSLLACLLPIGGNTAAQVAAAYPNLFTPDPITFAVWWIICLMPALFVLYQWEVLDGGRYSAQMREDVGLWFAVGCALTITWIFLWHYRKIGLAMIASLLLLLTLIVLRQRLGSTGSSLQRFAAKAGSDIALGWSIAVIMIDLAVLSVSDGWSGFGLPADFWTSALLILGAFPTAALVLRGSSPIAGLTVLWMYIGILIRHISPDALGAAHPYVISAAFVGAALIFSAILVWASRQIRTNTSYRIKEG